MSSPIRNNPVLVIGVSILLIGIVMAGIHFIPPSGTTDIKTNDSEQFRTFSSEEEFQNYVNNHILQRDYAYNVASEPQVVRAMESDDGGNGAVSKGGANAPKRYSKTNIQESFVHEPDILKTNGRTTFYSLGSGHPYWTEPVIEESPSSKPYRNRIGTVLLDTSTPENPELITNISNASGKMFLHNDILVSISERTIKAYDVSNRKNPRKIWSKTVNGSIVTTRMHNGTIYMVSSTGIGENPRCPVDIASNVEVDCTDIHRPTEITSVSHVTTVHSIDPQTGENIDRESYLTNHRGYTVYVSNTSIYISQTKRSSAIDNAVTTIVESEELDIPRYYEQVMIDISNRENMTRWEKHDQIQDILRAWLGAEGDNERYERERKLQQVLEEDIESNPEKYSVKTIITRFSYSDGRISMVTQGDVPGSPYGQFAFDEHNGVLRVSTTVSTSVGFGRVTDDIESRNNLYTLDSKTLNIEGSEKNMAPGQRIYAVRYTDDRAYLITFRQIDPLHVVDVSDGENPEELGNVELPGFSRYLHPINETHIIGVGEENGKVKIVLFDVSNEKQPEVEDSYILEDATWSAISRTHHAFTYDEANNRFFLPSEEGGHVFSYDNGISKEYTVDTRSSVKRVIYIGESIYVFNQDRVIVVEQQSGTYQDSINFFEKLGDSEDEDEGETERPY